VPRSLTGNQRGVDGLYSPVCFSTQLCYALGTHGDIVVSTDPFAGDAATWRVFHVPNLGSGTTDLECPSSRLCFALGNNGSRNYVIALRSSFG
jgi:hypothetical protein